MDRDGETRKSNEIPVGEVRQEVHAATHDEQRHRERMEDVRKVCRNPNPEPNQPNILYSKFEIREPNLEQIETICHEMIEYLPRLCPTGCIFWSCGQEGSFCSAPFTISTGRGRTTSTSTYFCNRAHS